MQRLIKTGDRIRVRKSGTLGEWTTGRVVLASENGQSVGIELDGVVRAAGWALIAGALPLNVDYVREEVTGLDGCYYEVEINETP